MRSHTAATAEFDYFAAADAVLAGNLDALNACVECCDRHAIPGRVALFWEGKDGDSASYTFTQLKELSGRFASFLYSLGVRPGDCVSGMLPRTPELLIAVLGTWRLGAVYQPLFTAFGPKAIEHRVKLAGSKVVVTDGANRASSTRFPTPPPGSPSAGRRGRVFVMATTASGPNWNDTRRTSNLSCAAAKIPSC